MDEKGERGSLEERNMKERETEEEQKEGEGIEGRNGEEKQGGKNIERRRELQKTGIGRGGEWAGEELTKRGESGVYL